MYMRRWPVCELWLFPFCAAQHVLGHFRSWFIDAVDANAIVQELVYQDIIGSGDSTTIRGNPDGPQQNQYLHACLLRTCDEEALKDVCEIIIAVKGNRRIRGLGKEMKSMLEGKWCVCSYMHICMCLVWTCMTQP